MLGFFERLEFAGSDVRYWHKADMGYQKLD
jgi:hypothetical protein